MTSKNKTLSRPKSLRAGHYLIVLIAVLFLASLVGNVALADTGPTQPEEPAAPAAATSPFGVEMTPVDASGGLNKIKTTRTYFVRGPEILWNEIQPTDSASYDWTKLDPFVVEFNNAKTVPNAEPIVVIRGTPGWAQKISGKTCGPMKASNYDEFATFTENLIAELSSRNITVKYWEIWNEPDVAWDQVAGDSLFGCWGNQADTSYYGGKEYGQMLSYVYPKIKASSPSDTKVIVGGLQMPCDPNNSAGLSADCVNRSKFFDGILFSGGGDYFDGVAFHAYDYWNGTITTPGGVSVGTYVNTNWPSSGWNNDGPSLIAKTEYIKSLLLKYNVFGKVILNTEVSMIDCDGCWNTNPYPPDLENTLANYVVQSYSAAIGQGLHAQIWYDVNGSWQRNNGLLQLYTLADLKSFTAYKYAAFRMDGVLTARRIVEYPGINGYEFDIGLGKHLWVVWSADGENRNLISPIAPNSIHDIYGVSQGTPTIIPVTKNPIYIEFTSSIARVALPFVRNYYPYNYVFNSFENGWLGWLANQTNSDDTNLPVSLINIHPPDPRNLSKTDPYVPLDGVSAYLGNGYLPCAGMPADAYAELVTTAFTVPPFNFDPLHLVFQYILYSQDYWNGSMTSQAYDNFEVYIEDTTMGTPPELKFRDGNRKNDLGCKWWRVPGPEPENERKTYFAGWATGYFDLHDYIDHTVKVYFRVYNRTDSYFNTYAFLDNVVIRVGPLP